MFPRAWLCVTRTWTRPLRGEMPCVRTPLIRIHTGEPAGLPQRFSLQKALILATPKTIGQDRTPGVIDRMPPPPLVVLLTDKPPPFIPLGFTGWLNVHAPLIGVQRAEQGRVDQRQPGFFLLERTKHRVGTDPSHPRRLATPTGVEAHIHELGLHLGQTPAVALVEQKTPLSTRGILASVAWFSPACFAAVDDRLAVTVGAPNGHECHEPLLTSASSQDGA